MRVGITGHRGLSEEVAVRVRVLLADAVKEYDPAELVGVSCVADGPDTWFAEAILSHGGRIEVVVPATEYRDALPHWHHSTYDRLIRQAADVHETGMTASSPQAHLTGGEILVGLVDELIAVWDGKPARGLGGTADIVAYAERQATTVRILWPEGASR